MDPNMKRIKQLTREIEETDAFLKTVGEDDCPTVRIHLAEITGERAARMAIWRKAWKKKLERMARREAMESLGMTKVRGALGGTYWE